MKTHIRINTVFIAIGITLLLACTKDLEDMNKDPHGFTTASDGSLFNGLVESLVLTGNEQFYINNEILYKQTQLAALTNDAWGSYTIGTESMWSNYYLILPNVRELEIRFSAMPDSGEVKNMKAMVKILLAYKTFKLSDIFGDMPFFNAGYGFQNLEYLHPKYDSQRDLYLFLLEELKWVDENIDESATSEEPFKTFKTFDRLFKGDMLKWRKLANSLRLRHAMRMSEKEPVLAGKIIKEIIESNRPVFYGYDFTTPVLESACLWPAEMGFKNSSLNWSFREHENLRMGSNIWHQISTHDSIDGSGIFDPRAYIYFEGNNENEWIPYPQFPDNNTPPSAGIPYEEHRDAAGNYSIKGDCYYSPFNYFLIRDEDFMPIILITGAEVHYIKAEAYFRGIGVAEDKSQAEIEYFNGILSSVNWWLNTASNSKLPTSGLKFPDMVAIPSNLNAVSVMTQFGFWNATSEEQKLEFIYTQWWLDAFRQPWEAYSLARRTGKTPREGNAIAHYRMPYPPSEVEYNSAEWSKAITNQGGDSPDVKIWWIP